MRWLILVLMLTVIFLTSCENLNQQPSNNQSESGCCTPYCLDLDAKTCSSKGGVISGTSCTDVEQCKVGCCTPFCQEMSKVKCSEDIGYGGQWFDQKCSSIQECQEQCCLPSREMETSFVCSQKGGTIGSLGDCSGSSSIEAKITFANHCDCTEGSDYDSCLISNSITKTFTGTFQPETNSQNNDPFGWSDEGDSNVYTFKGPGTYSVSGSSEQTKSRVNQIDCGGAQVTRVPETTTDHTTDKYDTTTSGESILTITKNDKNYTLKIDSPYKPSKYQQQFERTITRSPCPGEEKETSSTENINDEHDTEDTYFSYVFSTNQLSGSINVNDLYKPQGTFSCPNGEASQGTLSWYIALPENK